MIEVTQADRDAAACLLHGIKVGGGDGNTYYLSVPTPKDAAEAFARHRTTAEAAKDARIKELEAHIEGLNAIVESAQRAALKEIDNAG